MITFQLDALDVLWSYSIQAQACDRLDFHDSAQGHKMIFVNLKRNKITTNNSCLHRLNHEVDLIWY